MGWQDRDYAQHRPARATWSRGSSFAPGGRSVVTVLIIINVVIFLSESFFPAVGAIVSGTGHPAYPGIGELRADLVLKGQFWRLFTAQYLHANMGHLFINMLVLHFLGRSLERMWSAQKFVAVYTLCGLAGNIFFTVLGAQGVINPSMPAVGASGCIYGLLGIVAVLFPQATVYIYFLFPMKIRTAAMIFAGISVYTVINRGSNYGGEACHLAGLVFGVWWAMKGDHWWARRQWRMPWEGVRFRRPRVSGFQAQVDQRRADEVTIDRILKKVYDQGIHGLTASEKKALKEATARQQAKERATGRVDRL